MNRCVQCAPSWWRRLLSVVRIVPEDGGYKVFCTWCRAMAWHIGKEEHAISVWNQMNQVKAASEPMCVCGSPRSKHEVGWNPIGGGWVPGARCPGKELA